MGAWATAALARTDLRTALHDGAQDRLVKLKQVVGVVDGTNTSFQIFEERLVSGTLSLFVNNAAYTGTVTVTDEVAGTFTVSTPPASQAFFRATYYFQYFLDYELDEALRLAANEIVENDDITLVAPGLKTAALYYGKAFAFDKQAVRWATSRRSGQYVLEDEPLQQEQMNRADSFQKLADAAHTRAVQLRDNFYQRHGRREAPAFAMWKPVIPPVGPLR